jgi:hypothetical protein
MIPVGDVKLSGNGAHGYTSDIADLWDRMNSSPKAMSQINVIDRDRPALFGGLIDGI